MAQTLEQITDVREWQEQAIKDAVKEADSPDAVFLDHEAVLNRMKERRQPGA